MAYKMKPFKKIHSSKTQNYVIAIVAVFLLISLTYFTMSKTNSLRYSAGTSQLPQAANLSSTNTEVKVVVKHEKKPICDFSNTKSDICEAVGDARVVGKDTRVVLVAPSERRETEIGQSWTIKPYARKWDEGSGARVRPVTMKLVDGYYNGGSHCTTNYSVPGLVFAIGGWTGNFFHDFADVLVPLFETAYRFGGEVQLLIANNKPDWIKKYHLFFSKISKYQIIDYDSDDRVHCFKEVTLGLRCVPDDFRIDPSKDPYGISMVDFTKFLRTVYSLERDHPLRLSQQPGSKPRLLLITRTGSRRFTNTREIIEMVNEVGFEVIVKEGDPNVDSFSRIVNSCDVIMGVHGSGLTNLVFLPTNAVVIQIVPWGNLDWIAGNYFREPSKLMKLHYLEYSINEDETTLSDTYPRDHPVFTDPMSLHKQGWDTFSKTFLIQQHVRLDAKRFRPTLEKALQILREQSW